MRKVDTSSNGPDLRLTDAFEGCERSRKIACRAWGEPGYEAYSLSMNKSKPALCLPRTLPFWEGEGNIIFTSSVMGCLTFCWISAHKLPLCVDFKERAQTWVAS